MSLTLDVNEAKKADRSNSSIRVSGKYVGVITRAEKLLSKNKSEGLGLSFKTDDGATANYLDLYTKNAEGKTLPSNAVVNAILACTSTRSADEGSITFEMWDSEAKAMLKQSKNGYPALMGKRIGLLLQQELSDNPNDPMKHNDRVVIYGVFNADNELVASEILDKKTKPEQLEKMVTQLMARPVNDRRTNGAKQTQQSSANTFAAGMTEQEFDDSIPFN